MTPPALLPAGRFLPRVLTCVVLLVGSATASRALDGVLRSHDPSTVAICNNRYYVFSTGPGIPILTSEDGFTWKRDGRVFEKIPEAVRALSPKNNGVHVWAPDIIQRNGEYWLYYSVSAWGSFVSAIGLVTNPTLDRNDPRYKWTDRGPIVNSVEGQDLNAIDPGVVAAPDGTLWLAYGSYHGNIELVQLDPGTGLRIAPGSPATVIANRSEAADIIYREPYFYLFVNHGSCCKGKDSGYNIRVGRAKKVTGPYLDRNGDDLAQGAGSLFLAAKGRQIGPGHFGRFFDDGLERFSCHYEADLDRPGPSVLDIRPLLWTPDGWPVAGENLKAGTYQFVCERTGSNMELNPKHAEDGEVTLGTYLTLDGQKWSVAPAGGGFHRITGMNGKALDFTDDESRGAVVRVAAAAADSDAQLWKIDRLTDGSCRVTSKVNKLALTAVPAEPEPGPLALQVGREFGPLVLRPFTGDRAQRWTVTEP